MVAPGAACVKPLWAVATIAAPATAAVSMRRIVSVNRTPAIPADAKSSDSSGVHPPSGPTNRTRDAGGAASNSKIGRAAASTDRCHRASFVFSAINSAGVAREWIRITVSLPDWREASAARRRQRSNFLSPFGRTAPRRCQGEEVRDAQFGQFFDHPVRAGGLGNGCGNRQAGRHRPGGLNPSDFDRHPRPPHGGNRPMPHSTALPEDFDLLPHGQPQHIPEVPGLSVR